MFQEVDPKQSFPELEEQMLAFWQKNKIFQKSIDIRSKEKEYTFYDGPPFATGLPHYGHILAGALKDVIPRYFTMRGYRVERRFGWDCHGLPVENEVEKSLNLTSKKDIDKMGIDAFNEQCRSIVLKYVDEWEKVVHRMGRWVDFDNDYKTMDPNYMETIWWIFKRLWDKDLIYEGHKSMHICPRCETPLSNFEVTQGYKDIQDQSVTAKFQLKDEPDTYVLAWTTTPWTLPGNVALAVGSEIEYIKIQSNENSEKYIFAKNLFDQVIKKDDTDKFKIVEELKGSDIVGKRYNPLFDYFKENKELENIENAYQVIAESFVSIEDGTGIVHIAPAFGEDDMNAGRKHKLPFIQHIGIDGCFIKDVTDFHEKDAKTSDPDIIRLLKSQNKVFDSKTYLHSYPHCWRCDTPLLNYSTDSWFVKIDEIKQKLLKANLNINWIPENIKHGRFGKWLENARDWAISRNRYWGAPLPVWKCECGEVKCLGSMKDLYDSIPERFSRIIFIRHGESEGNLTDLRQSKEPGTPLTDEGVKQAEACAKLLEKEGVDQIVSSPLLRTKQTAENIAKHLELEVKVNEGLREINFGKNEGKTTQELIPFLTKRVALPPEDRYNQKIDGDKGESQNELGKRMHSFVMNYIKENPGKTTLFVTHSDPLRFFEKEFQGTRLKKIYAKGHKAYATPQYFYYDHVEEQAVDLHKHFVDKMEIDCEKCEEKMKRIPEVLDCWFESGSMPYAQNHYPFENKEWFEKNFPANFIAEGLDQTRGWFYTLVVLAAALFDKNPFQNVIVNGIVLAEDGKKMSKRLKNYPPPDKIFHEYGADAMRFYMMDSPVVKANDIRFSERGVGDVVKNVILPIWNVYSFFVTYANIDNWEPGEQRDSDNILDKFILSRMNSLKIEVTKHMDEYDIQKSMAAIPGFIDDLTNWYIRRSRRRFWKSENDEDKNKAYATLHSVLIDLSKIIAPVMPFLAEALWQNLALSADQKNPLSVHLSDWPEVSDNLIDKGLEEQVHNVRTIVNLGHAARAKAKIKVRQPLQKIQVGLPQNVKKESIESELSIITEELNIKEVEIIDDPSAIASITASPNARILGPKFGQEVQFIIKAAKAGEFKQLENGNVKVSVILDGVEKEYELLPEEIDIGYVGKEGFGVESSEGIVVALDLQITEDLEREGQARDLVRIIQDMRKEADYQVSDRIHISVSNADAVLDQFGDYIKKETLALEIVEILDTFDIEKEFEGMKICVKKIQA